MMIKSMTGYGRYEGVKDGVRLIVEMKSVNHRYCEVSIRIPRNLMIIEDKIKKMVQQRLHRGRIEINVSLDSERATRKKLVVDTELLQAYSDTFQELKGRFGLSGELSTNDLLQIEDLFQVTEDEILPTEVDPLILEGVKQASHQLLEMRMVEGKALSLDLKKKVASILDQIDHLEKHTPEVLTQYRVRLEARMKEYLEHQVEVDEERLLNEVAFFAEKSNIDEEITRLKSHCYQFQTSLTINEPVGRKLDFLLQEMNREVNTIGSKANDLQISQLVVDLKSTLEKIREQVQNIE